MAGWLTVQITPNRQHRNQFLANLKQQTLGKRVRCRSLVPARQTKADPTANLGEADLLPPGGAFRWRAAEARCYLFSTCTTRIGELQTGIALEDAGRFCPAMPIAVGCSVKYFVSLHPRAVYQDFTFLLRLERDQTRHLRYNSASIEAKPSKS